MLKFLKSTLNWYWKYYIVPADHELKENEFIDGKITLADGTVINADKFSFSEDFQYNFCGKVSAAEKVLEPEYLQLAVSAEDLEKNYILDIDLDNFLCRKALHPENTEFFQELAKHAKGISISMERDWQRLLRLRGETLTSDDVLSMLETLIGQKFA